MKKVNASVIIYHILLFSCFSIYCYAISFIPRAHFSALIPSDIWNAVRTLTPPDENQSKAADARQEIDLRIGCVFTRFQTLLLRNTAPEVTNTISYGPCQFPTLGFVVERYLQRQVGGEESVSNRTSSPSRFG